MTRLSYSESKILLTKGCTSTLFYELITNNMDETLDIEGRPLGEQRAPDLYAKTETIKIQCNYPGSRFQNSNPMNVSALKQIRQNKSEILYLFSRLRQNVCKFSDIERVTYLEVWEIASQAILLPLFIKLKYGPKIPAYAAGLYKVAFGLISVAMKLTLKETLGQQLLIDPSYVFQCVESSGELIGSSEVCAAPERLIKEVIHSIIYGDSLDKATNALKQLDIEEFLEFSKNSAHFQFCFLNYLIYIRNLYLPFATKTNSVFNKKYKLFKKLMKEKQEKKPIPPVDQIESLVSSNNLITLHARLHKKYFPQEININNHGTPSFDTRIKHLKNTSVLPSKVRNEMVKIVGYEEKQLEAFNFLLNKAAKTIIKNNMQPLRIKELEKAMGASPVGFFTDSLFEDTVAPIKAGA